ncbi:hypothetical protein D3C87_1127820 [compost metagenome]
MGCLLFYNCHTHLQHRHHRYLFDHNLQHFYSYHMVLKHRLLQHRLLFHHHRYQLEVGLDKRSCRIHLLLHLAHNLELFQWYLLVSG